jgi:hypothetical protein
MIRIKESNFNKLIQSFIIISGGIWIGSQITKILTIFYFFQTDEFGRINLKTEILPDTINIISYQLVPLFIVSIVSYLFFIILINIFLIMEKKHLKNRGWLFISFLIVLIFSPFEIYSIIIDFKIFELSFYRTGDSTTLLNLFRERVISLSSFPLISIFLHLTIVFLMIFKPLNKEQKIEN